MIKNVFEKIQMHVYYSVLNQQLNHDKLSCTFTILAFNYNNCYYFSYLLLNEIFTFINLLFNCKYYNINLLIVINCIWLRCK